MDSESLDRLIGKILANQEHMKEAITQHVQTTKELYEKREEQISCLTKKISAIEGKINKAAGAIAVFSAGLSYFFSYMLAKVKGV